MDIDRDTAKREILKIAHGEDSFVLHDCVTCYACEEYCPAHNHPFYLVVEKQEKLDVPPLPRPLTQRGINIGVPFRGEPEINEINGRALDMGVFSDLSLTVPKAESCPGKMTFHYIYQVKESGSGDSLDVNWGT
jgi:ferredoxin